ncbi:helix-turn-helix domain-containing protein [Gordonia liuliyuniae]|uniref:Helix-turn-helix transcriptional regulator n=1 Tax=Gordonia liuliyuniae TaxID=2911517 RepID=A0ABS9IWD4_9ACTN|nr:helix-turn-helix transcriptional regulator [Gordonia liuliyuniae]MCF8589869.1 helix-turn-helix transcriptional regulator [Gordonia liuliyuniae]
MVAAQRDIWRPTDLLQVFAEVGFTPSLSKVAKLWSGQPISVRLDELDKMCTALNCTIADLLEAEPVAAAADSPAEAVGDSSEHHSQRPVPRPLRAGRPNLRPPN